MLLGDTIAAICTGAAPGPKAILRLSGGGTRAAIESLTGSAPHPGCRSERLRVGAARLPVVIAFSAAPRSYTGEDAAEIQFPGGPALRERLLASTLSIPGVRHAEPGEFSARAYLHGKLTPEQAEGVAAVIAAGGQRELDAARRLLGGQTGSEYRSLADELATALALVEAGIDFSDQEDVRAVSPGALLNRLGHVSSRLTAFLGGPRSAQAANAEPVVVIAGEPNAGKSALFNALLARGRSVVSSSAGTTRDALRERLTLGESGWDDRAVWLVDLAGLDAALASRSEVDRAGQHRTLSELSRADLVLLCAPPGEPWPQAEWTRGRRAVRVRTKADLPGVATEPEADVRVCALDGWNLGALRTLIGRHAFAGSTGASGESVVWPRHRAALAATLRLLRNTQRVLEAVPPEAPLPDPELIAADLREALNELGLVCGRISPDEVIGRVFATFCVGK